MCKYILEYMYTYTPTEIYIVKKAHLRRPVALHCSLLSCTSVLAFGSWATDHLFPLLIRQLGMLKGGWKAGERRMDCSFSAFTHHSCWHCPTKGFHPSGAVGSRGSRWCHCGRHALLPRSLGAPDWLTPTFQHFYHCTCPEGIRHEPSLFLMLLHRPPCKSRAETVKCLSPICKEASERIGEEWVPLLWGRRVYNGGAENYKNS